MERNPNDSLSTGASSVPGGTSGSTGASALGAGTDSISVTGTGLGQNAASGAGTYGSTGGDIGSLDLGSAQGGSAGQQSLGDRVASARDTATDKLSQAKDVAGERLGQAKEKATQLKSTLADKLEAGANSLRSGQPADGAQFAGVGGATAESDAQLAQLKSTGANVLQKSADFLRTGDMRSSIEEQMRTNPGRTLLFAVGIGYVLGKAIRGGDRR
jgi:hypothetical protein